MKTCKNVLFLTIFGLCCSVIGYAQCETWDGKANLEELTENHSVYRGLVKTGDIENAYDPWLKVYNAAPAADGRRDFHYTDGIKIYKHFLSKETDEAKKKEYVANILRLYDEAAACYDSRAISLKCKGEVEEDCYNNRVAALHGRKGFDMYYEFQTPYSETIGSFEKAFEIAGNNAEYIVVVPYANMTVYEFLKERRTKEETRQVHDKLLELCNFNIENGNQYAEYYQQAKDAMLAEFAKVKYLIFDCDYFKKEWGGRNEGKGQ